MGRLTVYGRDGEPGYQLPRYARRLPWRLHPRHEAMRREARAWVRSFPEAHDWVREYRNGSSGVTLDGWLEEGVGDTYGCLAFPLALDERIRILCDINEWYTLLDDAAAGSDGTFMSIGAAARRAAIDRVVAILEGSGTAYDGGGEVDQLDRVCFGRMLADVWFRLVRVAEPGLRERFAADMSAAARTWVAEAETRAATPLDFGAYVSLRRVSVAAMSLPRFVELGAGVDLGSELMEHPALRELETLQANYLVFLNDLYSFRKEYVRSHDTWNLVAVLCLNDGYTLQEAIDRLCRLMETTETEFIRLRDAFVRAYPDAGPGVHAFVEGLGHVMSGTLQFHLTSTRYHGLRHNGDAITTGIVTLDTEGTLIVPSRASTLEEWWAARRSGHVEYREPAIAPGDAGGGA
jgi:hypothetical protein